MIKNYNERSTKVLFFFYVTNYLNIFLSTLRHAFFEHSFLSVKKSLFPSYCFHSLIIIYTKNIPHD